MCVTRYTKNCFDNDNGAFVEGFSDSWNQSAKDVRMKITGRLQQPGGEWTFKSLEYPPGDILGIRAKE